jgi:isocitrate dehydrogenase (NAD+)
MTATIAVLQGDQTGRELLDEALRVLAPEVIGLELTLRPFDLSLENRRATANAVVIEAAAAMVECGFGIKAATITPEHSGDVGSPNALLRQRVGGKVILRTGRRIPGVASVGGASAPMSVVRMAVDDAYDAREWREERDGDFLTWPTSPS